MKSSNLIWKSASSTDGRPMMPRIYNSKRKGTVGEKLPDEISAQVKARRSADLAQVADEVASSFIEKNREITHRVLIEESIRLGSRDYLTGYTGNYIRVYIASSGAAAVGSFVQARLTERFRDGSLATIVD